MSVSACVTRGSVFHDLSCPVRHRGVRLPSWVFSGLLSFVCPVCIWIAFVLTVRRSFAVGFRFSCRFRVKFPVVRLRFVCLPVNLHGLSEAALS